MAWIYLSAKSQLRIISIGALNYAKVEVYFTKVFYLLLHMLFVRLKAVCNNV